MKKYTACILVLSLMLIATGCAAGNPGSGRTQIPGTDQTGQGETQAVSDLPASPDGTASSEDGTADTPGGQDHPAAPAGSHDGPFSTGSFQASDFQGKIRQAAYGGGSLVLVLAEQLSLYDTAAGSILASVPCPFRDNVKIQPYKGGFAVMGRQDSGGGSEGMKTASGPGGFLCILYDGELKETGRISLSEILPGDDMIMSEACIALSGDGASLAIAGINGLYLYDLEKRSLSTLLDFDSQSQKNGLELISMEEIAFVSGGSRVAFLGTSFPSGGEKSVYTYGTVRTDGTEFENFRRKDYAIGDSLLVQDDLLVLPEDFTKATGKLLMYTVSTQEETVCSLSTSGEGKDGVFLSAQGDFFATAKLDGSKLIIRVYERSSGGLLHEETIKHEEELYFARIPSVLLLDASRTCIVLLGSRQESLDTLPVCFGF